MSTFTITFIPIMKKEKFKIAFVLDDSFDKTDGVQQYVATLGKWFGSQGHEVHYLVGETKHRKLKNIHSLSKNVEIRFNGNKISIPIASSSRKIKQLLSGEQFDILHIQTPYSPFLGGKILRFASSGRAAIIGTFHIMPYGQIQYLINRLLAYWQRTSLRQIDQMLSVSRIAQKFAERCYGVRSEVIPNTVDLFKYKELSPKRLAANTFNIVFIGRHVKRKGCLQLLRAFNGLRNRPDFKAIKLTVAGEGLLTSQMRKYVKLQRLSQNVNFTGYLSERDKQSVLSNADVAVFPSTSGESFGIVLIEAMAAGAGVVIGGNNPGYKCVLGKWPECLFDPNDITDFTSRLEYFIDNNKRRSELHSYQQIAVRQYDVAVVGARLEEVYKTQFAKKRGSSDN